ncbi:MAG TPA: signal peptidase II [Anaeromyxobacteraceae bacterium]|nr:signal peptidase II [Anaeromyxobacteraceae bacterium]
MSKWRILLLILALGLLADQGSKYLAVERLTTVLDRGQGSVGDRLRGFYALRHLEAYATEPHVVWAPMWRMRYAENPGAAWGLFRGLSESARSRLFGLITLTAVGFILVYFRRLEREQRFLQVALAFVLTGALGNFLDRLARGYVIDFVDWYWWNRPDLYWPTFNVADSFIVVGVAMLVLHPAPKKDPVALRE